MSPASRPYRCLACSCRHGTPGEECVCIGVPSHRLIVHRDEVRALLAAASLAASLPAPPKERPPPRRRGGDV